MAKQLYSVWSQLSAVHGLPFWRCPKGEHTVGITSGGVNHAGTDEAIELTSKEKWHNAWGPCHSYNIVSIISEVLRALELSTEPLLKQNLREMTGAGHEKQSTKRNYLDVGLHMLLTTINQRQSWISPLTHIIQLVTMSGSINIMTCPFCFQCAPFCSSWESFFVRPMKLHQS